MSRSLERNQDGGKEK